MKPSRLRFTTTVALSATNISAAAATVALTPLTLVGTPTLGTGETESVITFTFAAAEPTLRLLIKGTSWNGNEVWEAVLGPAAAGTVRSIRAFRTITSILPDRASAGTVSVGWASPLASRLMPLDYLNLSLNLTWHLTFTGVGAAGTISAQVTQHPILGFRGFPSGTSKPLNALRHGSDFDLFSPVIDGSLESDLVAATSPIAVTANAIGVLGVQVTGIRMTSTTAIVGAVEFSVLPRGSHNSP